MSICHNPRLYFFLYAATSPGGDTTPFLFRLVALILRHRDRQCTFHDPHPVTKGPQRTINTAMALFSMSISPLRNSRAYNRGNCWPPSRLLSSLANPNTFAFAERALCFYFWFQQPRASQTSPSLFSQIMHEIPVERCFPSHVFIKTVLLAMVTCHSLTLTGMSHS
jgi:hypothetical protein